MSKQRKARLACFALPYLEPVVPVGRGVADLATAFLSSGAQTPARMTVEARSDMTFIDDLVDSLTGEVSRETAELAALTVLQSPTVALRHGDAPRGTRILQSVVMAAESPEEFDAQVTVQLTVEPGKPAGLRVTATDIAYVDLVDDKDTLDLVRCVERWWTEFSVQDLPAPRQPSLRPWAWLGDPQRSGILAVPPDWRSRVRRLGDVYGLPPHVVDSAGQIKAWTLAAQIQHAVVLRGSKLAAHLQPSGTEMAISTTEVGAYGDTFEAVLDQVRTSLLDEALAAHEPLPTTRLLAADEIVYHRKVGDSRKFDSFDAGSSQPCPHGAESFKPWDAEKAIKGMVRRYDNFTASMLIHCRKYPDCGMYGVDARRG